MHLTRTVAAGTFLFMQEQSNLKAPLRLWSVLSALVAMALGWLFSLVSTTGSPIVVGVLTGVLVYLIAARLLQEAQGRIDQLNDRFERMSSQDGLTGLANRRYFDNMADQEWRRARRGKAHLAMLAVELNGFSEYNALFGQQLGDDALKLVASSIEEVAKRPADVVARYGGCQFAVLLPETNEEGARVVANKVDAEVQALGLPSADGAAVMTVTIGLASGFGGQEGGDTTASTLISTALADLNRAEREAPAAGESADDFML